MIFNPPTQEKPFGDSAYAREDEMVEEAKRLQRITKHAREIGKARVHKTKRRQGEYYELQRFRL